MTKDIIEEFVEKCINPGSVIKTDKFKSYAFLNKKGYKHELIRIYNPKETLECLPWVHIMSGNIKGILKGVHHGVSPKYLQRFCPNFVISLIVNLLKNVFLVISLWLVLIQKLLLLRS